MRSLSLLLCLILISCLPIPRGALAETVVVSGANGTDGADGAPGMPGGPGGDGESVIAVSGAALEANEAIAFGGRGGSGGRGGDALPGSGADGADGGIGGRGGDAVAEATTTGHAFVRAEATGGAAGSGGSGGTGSPPGDNGSFGSSRPGGSATATASVERSYDATSTSPGLDGRAIAEAGRGNDARAIISGTATGTGSPNRVHILEAVAEGGQFGSLDGNAWAEATGSTTHGSMTVIADADAEGNSTGGGGDATAIAVGTHSGSGHLAVSATANVFDGVFETGSNEGEGFVRASGIATGGADVDVTANLFGSRDAEFRDAVSGSTSGSLSLQQTVGFFTIGPFFASPPAVGETRTGLVADNPGGGDLDILLRANATNTEADIPGDGDLVLGDVIGRSDSGANVDVEVIAIARRIRQENLDDAGQRSQIFGSSNGGDVSVRADWTALSGGFSTLTDDALIGAPGRSISMDDAVGGETSGQLYLESKARAEDARSLQVGLGGSIPIGSRDVLPGDGGDVFNRVTRSGAFGALTIRVDSLAGMGGSNGSTRGTGAGGRGGSSENVVDATNESGALVISGRAAGHQGGGALNDPGAGGDASIDFRGTTWGDGHSVLIGSPTELTRDPVTFRPILHGARGGEGGNGRLFLSRGIPPATARGGHAASRSIGVAHGDSEVEVYDIARGGDAGAGGGPGFGGQPLGTGERGGDAVSTASATGGGGSSVLASSQAFGGSGSERVATGGSGGNAEAASYARGYGEVRSTAVAIGGDVSVIGTRAGAARALAEVEGPMATAIAEARTGYGSGETFRAALTRETTTRTRLDAIATYAGSLPAFDPENSGSAFISGQPLPEDVDDARGRHRALDALLVDRPGATIEAIGQWSARADKRAVSTQLVELDITLAPPESEGDLALAIFKIDAVSGGFQSLSFRLEVLGEAFGEEVVFENLAAANTYFSSLIGLGEAFRESFNGGDPAVRAIFEVVTREQQRIAFGIAAVVIPEPSTALLLGIGLALFAARRRRESS